MLEHFLLDPAVTFLNHGSYGACPADVFRVYQEWQLRLERNPVEFLGRLSADALRHARATLAARLGTVAENLVFVSNTTTGVNAIAKSLSLQSGDEILATDHEYGACSLTWQQVCAASRARYVQAAVPLPFRRDDFCDHVWRAVTPRTRVIFISHVTSTTALIFPIAALCARARKAGILTVIDGAHAPGHIDLEIDVLGADFYVGNCHKWLMAPKGSAFLYARPERQEMVHGLVTSWGYADTVEGHFGFDAYTGSTLWERRHQWQGTRDLAAFLAVPAALDFRYMPSLAQRFEATRDLAQRTHDRLVDRNGTSPIALPDDFCQMVAVPIRTGRPSEVQARLFKEFGIEVPFTSHRGQHLIRVSLQVYNTPDDIERLVSALDLIDQDWGHHDVSGS